MDRLQIFSIVGAGALLVIVLELVRRRRLLEGYSLLWLLAAAVLLGLAVWRDGLERLAKSVGVLSAPNALFLVAIAFIVLLLLHFSTIISRLSNQTKVLAQRLALAEEELRSVDEKPHKE